jgi:hypothetical protein
MERCARRRTARLTLEVFNEPDLVKSFERLEAFRAMKRITLVTGGARSGKSRYAVEMAMMFSGGCSWRRLCRSTTR